MTPTGVRTSEMIVSGLRSPMIESGPSSSDEAAVFVHGNPGSSQDFAALVERTGEFARAVAIDMPGFGRGDKPADFDYTVLGYARHLEVALSQLGVRRAHLVLHDFGGPWGLEWACAHPDAFASATLVGTGVLIGYHWHYLARVWRTPLLGNLFQASATRAAFGLLLRHGNPRRLPKEFVDRMYSDYDRGTRRAVLRLYRATPDPAGDGQRQADILRLLDRPALVVWGRHDPYLSVALAERQRQAFPRARIVILDRSGHWPFVDDPDSVATAVIPFLREQFGA